MKNTFLNTIMLIYLSHFWASCMWNHIVYTLMCLFSFSNMFLRFIHVDVYCGSLIITAVQYATIFSVLMGALKNVVTVINTDAINILTHVRFVGFTSRSLTLGHRIFISWTLPIMLNYFPLILIYTIISSVWQFFIGKDPYKQLILSDLKNI